MFGNNQSIIEFRITGAIERSDRADVVKCTGFITQGKKEDDKKPIFFTLQAWKYAAKVLEGMQEKKLYMAIGNWSQNFWQREGVEQSRLVFTASEFGEKLFAPQQSQGGQSGYQNQGYQNLNNKTPVPNQNYQGGQNQGYNQTEQDEPPF